MHPVPLQARNDLFFGAELPVNQHAHPDAAAGAFFDAALEPEPLQFAGRVGKSRTGRGDFRHARIRCLLRRIGGGTAGCGEKRGRAAGQEQAWPHVRCRRISTYTHTTAIAHSTIITVKPAVNDENSSADHARKTPPMEPARESIRRKMPRYTP